MTENSRGFLTFIAAIVILAATVLFMFYREISPWMLGGGGILLMIARMTRRMDEMPLRLKRALRLELFSALLITAAAVFMYMEMREWVALLLSAAILQLYSSFIISRELKKNAKNEIAGKKK